MEIPPMLRLLLLVVFVVVDVAIAAGSDRIVLFAVSGTENATTRVASPKGQRPWCKGKTRSPGGETAKEHPCFVGFRQLVACTRGNWPTLPMVEDGLEPC